MSVVGAPDYWRDGYLGGLPCLDDAAVWRARLVAARSDAAASQALIVAFARLPAIASAITPILGPNLLVRNVDIVVRPPFIPFGTTWHRDSPFHVRGVDRLVTAWVGLDASTRWNGCVRFLPGSHRVEGTGRATGNIDPELRSGLEGIDRSVVAHNLMPAGHLSLHHPRTVHGSVGNFTWRARIGVVVRVFAADIDPRLAGAGEGMPIAGKHHGSSYRLLDSCPVRWTG